MRLAQIARCLVLVSFILCSGCSSRNKGKIEGSNWSSLPGNVKGQAIPAGVLKLEFHQDGSLIYRAGPQTLTGKYSMGMGDRVTLNFDQPLAGRNSHVETIVINGDRLTMTDSDGTQITFEKK